MQRIFDDQIEKMFDLIDAELHKLLIEHPRERVVSKRNPSSISL